MGLLFVVFHIVGFQPVRGSSSHYAALRYLGVTHICMGRFSKLKNKVHDVGGEKNAMGALFFPVGWSSWIHFGDNEKVSFFSSFTLSGVVRLFYGAIVLLNLNNHKLVTTVTTLSSTEMKCYICMWLKKMFLDMRNIWFSRGRFFSETGCLVNKFFVTLFI